MHSLPPQLSHTTHSLFLCAWRGVKAEVQRRIDCAKKPEKRMIFIG
jgi:hypothetical protein